MPKKNTDAGVDVESCANTKRLILDILLKDRTTQKNITWATNDYVKFGTLYGAKCEITPELITENSNHIIHARSAKSLNHQLNRTKEKAEVFTPSWICNVQNNLIDGAWFGREHVFNTECGKSWNVNPERIAFDDTNSKTWKKYVDSPRMEITCGEAPYLVSRYDAVRGTPIPVAERIGLLDRKLRIVNENTDSESDWFEWVVRAYQSIYGFEFQGDNLLLARKNLLETFVDNLDYKFHRKPTVHELKKIATIISWNLWQMDGLKFTVPYGGQNVSGQYCRIKDWQAMRRKKKGIIEYRAFLKKR